MITGKLKTRCPDHIFEFAEINTQQGSKHAQEASNSILGKLVKNMQGGGLLQLRENMAIFTDFGN